MKYAVQMGSFKSESSALKLLGKLRLNGFDCRFEKPGKLAYVLCGDFGNSYDADLLRRSLLTEGYMGAELVSSPLEASTISRNLIFMQVGNFSVHDNALKVVDVLSSKGVACRTKMIDGLFKVYCGPLQKREDVAGLRKRLALVGYAGAFSITLPEWPFFVSPPVVVVPPPRPSSPPTPTAVPVPPQPLPVPKALFRVAPQPEPRIAPVLVQQSLQEGIDGSIFGRGGGYFHPFVSLSSFYTDNIYFARQDVKADFITVGSGGILLAAPGTKGNVIRSSSGSLPGGVLTSSIIKETLRPYQAYVLYRLDAEQYATYDTGNYVNHSADALVALNSDAGHRLELSGIYQRSHDAKGEEPLMELGEFISRQMGASAVFAVSRKLQLRVDYGRFMIDYDKDSLLYKEHEDSSYSGYVYFRILPKTSVFLKYASTKIDYDDQYDLDSIETDYLAGVNWDLTGKTTGSLSAGYSTRVFDTGVREDGVGFKVIGSMIVNLSEKSKVGLDVERLRRESGIVDADYVDINKASVSLQSEPVSKFSWEISASIAQSEYIGVDQDRSDKDSMARLKFKYEFKKWLSANMGLKRNQRTSSDPDNDYSANTVFMGFSARM